MSTRHKIGLLIISLSLALAFGGKGCELPAITPAVSAPFKTDKLAVLVVEETQDRAKLPAWVDATGPGSLQAAVKARGGSFRKLDANQTDFSYDAPWVAEAFRVPHPQLPWIVAAGPRTGLSQPLPATAAEALKAVEGVK